MAGKVVRFHPEAEQEYLTALSWYWERSPVAAVDFEQAVSNAVRTISAHPQRWPIYVQEFRKYSLHQFPFSIVMKNSSQK